MQTPVDISYLADTVVLLRYFEATGEVRQAISVVKKRSGRHERTIREFRLGQGVHVGAPLTDSGRADRRAAVRGPRRIGRLIGADHEPAAPLRRTPSAC